MKDNKFYNDYAIPLIISVGMICLSLSAIFNCVGDLRRGRELTKETQELQLQIETLNQENSLLKEEIENLKGNIELLQDENEMLKEEIMLVNELITAEFNRSAILDELSDLEWTILYRVARAEAGPSSREGQMHVVYVVLNRMESERFTQDSISEVVFAPTQFSVVENGSFYTVEISEFTMENVHDAYINWRNGERFYNALFFHSGAEVPGRQYIIHDEVGHHFY